MSEGGRRGGGARQRAADSGYIPSAAASVTQTRARPLNITILEDCWDAITTLESDRDKNDLWRTLRKAAKRGDTDWYWTCLAVGEGPDRWREFELEVVRALLSDNDEVHCIMRTAVVDWSSDMDTRDADGGHFPLEAMLGAEGARGQPDSFAQQGSSSMELAEPTSGPRSEPSR